MDPDNYFSFFDLPVAFTIDEKLLKGNYYENTRRYHPDHFGQESEAKQAAMLELATQNNNAYKTLKDFNSRVHYVLDLHGMVTEGDKHPLPPSFLAEMMDVNEALMELEMDPEPAKLEQTRQQVETWEEDINSELRLLATKYDTAPEPTKPLLLQQIKESYHKSKYILRLKDSLAKFAPL